MQYERSICNVLACTNTSQNEKNGMLNLKMMFLLVWVGQIVDIYKTLAYPAYLLSGLLFCQIRLSSRESTVYKSLLQYQCVEDQYLPSVTILCSDYSFFIEILMFM